MPRLERHERRKMQLVRGESGLKNRRRMQGCALKGVGVRRMTRRRDVLRLNTTQLQVEPRTSQLEQQHLVSALASATAEIAARVQQRRCDLSPT